MELPEVCVCYLTRGDPTEVLLGTKKLGLGAGKLVGPGGKLEIGESPVEAIIREVREEVGLDLVEGDLSLVGEIDYFFPTRVAWSQKSWVFRSSNWVGDPVESEELAPGWFKVQELPIDRMWDDARHWVPGVLAGESMRGTFVFGDDLSTLESWELA